MWAALLVTLCASACGPSTEEVPRVEPSQANPLDAAESELLTLLNERRTDAGAGSVGACASLNRAAAAHSDDMLEGEFLDNAGSDGSTARQRACDEGYAPACDGSALMMELVSQGNPDAGPAITGWASDEGFDLALDPALTVAGIGRAVLGKDARWTLDLADTPHESCADSP